MSVSRRNDEPGLLQPGQILLLENLRFHPEEEANDARFAGRLASLGEVYVNDAFGAAHRAHASTEGISHHLPVAVSGLLMEQEIHYLNEVLEAPQRPFVAILGGGKVSGKIKVMENLLGKVDGLLIGGAMSFTFFRATELEVGASLVEEDRIGTARRILERAKARGVELLLPRDCVVTTCIARDSPALDVTCDSMPAGWQGVDIGPRTCHDYSGKIKAARTVVWNGPMGVFELEPFAAGYEVDSKGSGRSCGSGIDGHNRRWGYGGGCGQGRIEWQDDPYLHWRWGRPGMHGGRDIAGSCRALGEEMNHAQTPNCRQLENA